MHPIVVVRQPRRRPLHLSLRTPIEVGRECDGLLVADPQVSRKHLLLDPTDGFVTVTDLGSTNGTFLDGHRIDQPVVLGAHQVLQIGDTTMALVLEETHGPGHEVDASDTGAAVRVAVSAPVSIDPLISAEDTPVRSAGPHATDVDAADDDNEPIFDFSHLDDSPVDQRQPMYDFSDARRDDGDVDREQASPVATWNFGDVDDDSAIESVSLRPLPEREERSLLGPVWDPLTEAPRAVPVIGDALPGGAADPPVPVMSSDTEALWADAPRASETGVEDADVDDSPVEVVRTADAVIWADDGESADGDDSADGHAADDGHATGDRSTGDRDADGQRADDSIAGHDTANDDVADYDVADEVPSGETSPIVAVTDHAPPRHVVMVVAEIDPADGLGDGAVDELFALLDRVVDDRSASFGGTVAEHRAGSATIEFADARDALYCALAVRRDVKTHSVLHPNRVASVRVGIHAGTGLARDVADVAERLARSADGGEILVTPDGCRGVAAEPFEFGATHSVDVADGRVDAVALTGAASVPVGQ